MRKIITLVLFFVLFSNASAQIIQIDENWPNNSWSIEGAAYAPEALISNPTLDEKFTYIPSIDIPESNISSFYVVSPLMSLKPAFVGGEKALKLNFDISYETYGNSVIVVQYWNADRNEWVVIKNTGKEKIGDFNKCLNKPVTILLDFSEFSSTQMENFRYRFSIQDHGDQLAGVCIGSPTITSFMVLPPSNLNVVNINTTDINTTAATLNWMGNNGYEVDTSYDLQYGLHGFLLGTGIITQHLPSSITLSGLANGVYDFYVRENLHNDNTVYSSWSGPVTFASAILSVKENEIKGLKLYPNPTNDVIWLDSKESLNEVIVYNLAGQQLIRVKQYESNAGIDLSSLSRGIYFVKVNSSAGSGSYKVIKK